MENEKVWFITGASKGLGLALAKQLLHAGHKVAATSRDTESLIKAINYEGNAFLPLGVQLGNDSQVAAAIQQTKEQFGRIDVVVNNAGYGIGGSIEELTDKETRDSFEINVFGMINVIRHVLPILRQQGSGHIINISSIAGIAPATGWSVYGAAKYAVIGLTEVLAEDVKALGIKATVIAPGAFRTNFLKADSLVLSEKKIDAYAEIRASHESDMLR
jgi:NAD(P)-dependent dehydrogenase (short-subunit alcohol dehydrogenase family)